MKTNKPEIVAWRWRKPVVNDQGETVGATAWELSDAPGFLPWWTNDPLVRLSDYQRLQAEREELREALVEARDLVAEWGDYASYYFKEKHNLARDLERLDAVIAAHRKQGGEA